MLIDNFSRSVNYLRISVTDRCDFRCTYCMHEQMDFLPRERVLSFEELHTIAEVFVDLGVRKIRITGGEPLVRKELPVLLEKLSALQGLDELVMTTNASQLDKYAMQLKQAGVNRLNISLDSLREDRFRAITRFGELSSVLNGIEAAKKAGFKSIKLNAVIQQGVNDDEVADLCHFAINRDMDISYIEEMPLGYIDSHQRHITCVTSDRIFGILSEHFQLLPVEVKSGVMSTDGPARKFRIGGSNSLLGLISPHSHNFCASCNRLRLTAEGRLLLCLGNEHSIDLKAIIRDPTGSVQQKKQMLRQAIVTGITNKPESHHFDLHDEPLVRFMNMTGG